MTEKQLLSLVRQAIDDYRMIENGDRIAVGISGGKDSLTLLTALHSLKRFYPADFSLFPILIDLGFPDQSSGISRIVEFCGGKDAPLTVVPTEIARIVFDIRHESNPCSLCAKLRRGALNEAALSLGCNKVAYGHHKNDFVETLLLSLCFEGRLSCFPPFTRLDRTDLTVIRPLMYVDEADIRGFAAGKELPVLESKCPADGNTARAEIKQKLADFNKLHHGTSERIFHALVSSDIEGYSRS